MYSIIFVRIFGRVLDLVFMFQLPSSSTWGQQVNSGGTSQSTLSLAEIQKLEEERERQNQEEVCVRFVCQ